MTFHSNPRIFTRACLIFTFLFAVASTARTDDLDNTVFEGTVVDGAGAVIAGAKITASNSATGARRSCESDREGRFRLLLTDPGRFVVEVTAAGFKEDAGSEFQATAGRRIIIDFVLSPAGVSEQVTIAASSPALVDTTRTVVGETITRGELESLPIITRDPLELVLLLGGVAEAPLTTSDLADEGRGQFLRRSPEEAGLFSLTGAPATSNNITVDGLDNNDDRAARERISLNPESVAEVQVITNQYAAEYGRASGGRVNIRTRGGANRFNGDAYFFFGDEALNANTFYRNARGEHRVAQQQRREGVTFAGPLRRRKLFFFSSYERADVTDSVDVSALVPVETNPLFPLPKPNQTVAAGSAVGRLFEELSTPEIRNLFNTRADANFAESHNATVRLDLVRGANKRGFPGGTRLPETILIEGRDTDSISVTDNLVISKSVVNSIRLQFSRLLPRSKGGAARAGVVIQEPDRVIAGGFTGSDSAPAFARQERRTQAQDSLSLMSGSHMVKLGADIQLVRSAFTDLFAVGGQFTFESVADFLANRPARFIQRLHTESRLRNNVVGLFLQDEWKLKPNLTLSAGARWDDESILNDRDNFSPRLAIAWDPFGGRLAGTKRKAEAGKTVVRAGFGLFYNRALLRTIDDFSLGKSTVILDSEIAPDLLAGVRFPDPVSEPSLIERFGIKETGFLRRISPDLEIPYTIQTGLGVERQVNRRLVVSADYIFTRGAHLWRESNVNAPVVPEPFESLTDYLLSRDFDNRPGVKGRRAISGANADVVRFDLGANTSTTPGAIKVESGVRILTLGLNAPRSSNINAALNAVRPLRPDPSLTQVELLESTGNSFYHGGIFSARYSRGRSWFRVVYTLSKLIDEGTTNTASPQDLSDRRSERALSLQDRRHRIGFSGQFQVPVVKLDFAPIISFGSSRPFNIGAGVDRNLNDIENDRPNFLRPIARPVWRRPGSQADDTVKSALALAPIGSSGNLPRNYGLGPRTQAINLRASRTFVLDEKVRIRPAVDVFNLFNNTTFSYGAEFINRDDADFLMPRRTERPRTVQLSLKMSF